MTTACPKKAFRLRIIIFLFWTTVWLTFSIQGCLAQQKAVSAGLVSPQAQLDSAGTFMVWLETQWNWLKNLWPF